MVPQMSVRGDYDGKPHQSEIPILTVKQIVLCSLVTVFLIELNLIR